MQSKLYKVEYRHITGPNQLIFKQEFYDHKSVLMAFIDEMAHTYSVFDIEYTNTKIIRWSMQK